MSSIHRSDSAGMTDLRLFRDALRFVELRSDRRELSLKMRQALAWPG